MKYLSYFLLLVLFALSVFLVYTYLPVDVDWSQGGPPAAGVDYKGAFRPALIKLVSFESPYSVTAFFNPPWVLIPLLPLAFVSPALGAAVMFVLNFACWIIVAARSRMNPLAFTVFILFSHMFTNSWNGNIEGIAALGFILPPPIGMFFVLAKPQFGAAVAIFWTVEAYRKGGLPAVTRVALPVLSAIALSVLVFSPWPLQGPSLVDVWWNSSVFPYGIPAGVILLGLTLWRRDIRFAIAASPFFAPYLTGHTWAVVWFGLLLFVPSRIEFRRLVTSEKVS